MSAQRLMFIYLACIAWLVPLLLWSRTYWIGVVLCSALLVFVTYCAFRLGRWRRDEGRTSFFDMIDYD